MSKNTIWLAAASLMPTLALSAPACDGGGHGQGPGGGDGAGGGGGACVPTIPDDNTVATFEDGFGSVLPQGAPPRNGGFYAYNDGTTACMETPAAGSAMPAATAIDGGRCGSNFAFRFYGSGCMGYAGVGTDLAAPLPVDGGGGDAGDAAPGSAADGGVVAQKVPYDLSGYKQLTFWGRMGALAQPPNQAVQLKLPMLVDTKVQDGGSCVEMPAAKCSASYGRFLPFTQSWRLYTVDLIARPPSMCSDASTGICQEGWGRTFPWDPTNVVSIQFQAAPSTVFDIWIDDINLVPR